MHCVLFPTHPTSYTGGDYGRKAGPISHSFYKGSDQILSGLHCREMQDRLSGKGTVVHFLTPTPLRSGFVQSRASANVFYFAPGGLRRGFILSDDTF